MKNRTDRMVIVSMKGAAYPVCGMLEQSEFDALAALKQQLEGKK